MRRSFLLPLGMTLVFGSIASAQTTQTWNTNIAGSNWSATGNWTPTGNPSGNDLIFGDTAGETSNATTVGNIVDTNFTANSLTYNNTGTTGNFWQVTQIGSGVTLTLDAATAPATIFTVGNTATSGSVALTGAGTFTINEATSNIVVGTTATGSGSTLTMSGLSNFNATAATVNFGASRGRAVVTLADTNSITATTLNLGTSTSSTSAGASNTIILGASNTLNISTINVGLNFASGSINFRSGLTNPTATIRGTSGGTSRADLTIGNTNAIGITNVQGSVVDFSGSGGSVDALLNNLVISRRGDTGTTTSYTNSLTMAKGSIDATSVILGQSAGTGVLANTTTGTLNVSGGTFTAGSLAMADNSAGATSVVSNLNISGTAAVTVTGNLTAGSRSGTATNVAANINITGGTLLIQGNLAEGTGGAGVASTVTFSGGTIDMDHGNISVDTFTQTAGSLKNVAAFSAGTTGGLNLQNSSKLAFDIDSSATTLSLTGTLTLGATSDLVLTLANGFTPGSSFTLVDNDLSDAITGTFATINGSAFGAGNTFALTNNLGTFSYQLLYNGGTGNDLVFQSVPEPSTYALLGIGMTSLWILRRRKKA